MSDSSTSSDRQGEIYDYITGLADTADNIADIWSDLGAVASAIAFREAAKAAREERQFVIDQMSRRRFI